MKVEEKNLFLSRENAEITSKIEDGEDEVEELIKKNRNLNSEVSVLITSISKVNFVFGFVIDFFIADPAQMLWKRFEFFTKYLSIAPVPLNHAS